MTVQELNLSHFPTSFGEGVIRAGFILLACFVVFCNWRWWVGRWEGSVWLLRREEEIKEIVGMNRGERKDDEVKRKVRVRRDLKRRGRELLF
jgi:hypothetical protein